MAVVFLDDLGAGAGGEQEAGRGMPERVQVDAAEDGPLSENLEPPQPRRSGSVDWIGLVVVGADPLSVDVKVRGADETHRPVAVVAASVLTCSVGDESAVDQSPDEGQKPAAEHRDTVHSRGERVGVAK